MIACRRSQFESTPPPRQVQTHGTAHAEFVICDCTIDLGFLDDKSAGFQLEDTELLLPRRLDHLSLIMAWCSLSLVSLGTHLVARGQRPMIDAHYTRRLSYLQLGWRWLDQLLADPYLRFYYRFIVPNLNLVEQEMAPLLWKRISEQFRAFVGETAFEELCREWTLAQARAGQLPFLPELVASHWASDAQVDVVAINWQDNAILLGECKWGVDTVGRSVVRELVEKTPLVTPGRDWQVHYAFFARAGFADAARSEAKGNLA